MTRKPVQVIGLKPQPTTTSSDDIVQKALSVLDRSGRKFEKLAGDLAKSELRLQVVSRMVFPDLNERESKQLLKKAQRKYHKAVLRFETLRFQRLDAELTLQKWCLEHNPELKGKSHA